MSSIMDALKRMEDEGKSNNPLDLSEPVRKRRGVRLSGWVIALVFTAGVSASAGGMWIYHTLDRKEVAVVAPVSVEKVNSGETPEKSLRVVAATPTDPAPIRVMAPAQPELPPPPLISKEPAKPIKSEPVSKPTVETALSDMQLADTSRFELQGLRWSETPTRRIAVINNQILRQGGMVDGVRIVSIVRGGVILEEGGEKMLLEFKR